MYVFRNAFLAAFLISVLCGVVGSFVVVKRISLMSGGISHAAFGGIGLGYFLRISDPLIAAIPFSVLSAIGIGVLSRRAKMSEDISIGIFWAFGMALGILLVNMTPGYAPNLLGFLFGNILLVSPDDIIMMLTLDIFVLVLISLFYEEFLAISFDEEFAKIVGIHADFFNTLLLVIIAISIIVMIKVVGVILVIAMLIIPAAICKQFTNSMKILMISSIFASLFLTITGLWLSFIYNVPSGATIVLISSCAFFLISLIKC